VPDPSRFGVATIDSGIITSIEEKPKQPKSHLAVTGIYIYDNNVFDIIDTCQPSARGELEISDVNAAYLSQNAISFTHLSGWWSDAGTFDSLTKASELVLTSGISE